MKDVFIVKAQEFENRIDSLIPENDPEAMAAWHNYAEELDKAQTCPKDEFYRDLYIELHLVCRRYQPEIAQQLFDSSAEIGCFNPFEIRGAANMLKDGINIQTVMKKAIEGFCEPTPEEIMETEEALKALESGSVEEVDIKIDQSQGMNM